MSFLTNKIIASLVLTAFMAVIFLSFPMMVGMSDGGMSENCPLSFMGMSLCLQDTLGMAVMHISSYQSFLSITVGITVMLSVLLLSFVASVIMTRLRDSLLNNNLVFVRIDRFSPYETFGKRKITSWLSLFENSPANV